MTRHFHKGSSFCFLIQNRYIDEDQLVVNMKKVDGELKWPDIVESWESLTAGMMQLLKGASIYIVGDSTQINQKVSRELAVGLGYAFRFLSLGWIKACSFSLNSVPAFPSSALCEYYCEIFLESDTVVMICRYSPLDSKELLESFSKQTIDSCESAFG